MVSGNREFAGGGATLGTESAGRLELAIALGFLLLCGRRGGPASLALELWSNRVDVDSIVANAGVSNALRAAVDALVTAARAPG